MKKTTLAVIMIFAACAAVMAQPEGGAAAGQGAADARGGEAAPKASQKGGGKKGGGTLGQEAVTAISASCRQDIERFCKGVEAGPGQGRCLKQHQAELSAECGKTLKELRPPEEEGGKKSGGAKSGQGDPGAGLMKACQGDAEKFCKGIAAGLDQGRCLMEHQAELSAECGKTLESLPSPEEGGGPDGNNKGGRAGKAGKSRSGQGDPGAAIMKACKADAAKLCSGIAAGPEQGRCLKQHETELSAECGRTLRALPPPGQAGGGKGNQSAIAKLMKACKADAEKFCSDVEEGPELGRCLMERETELSAGCGETLKSLPPPDQGGDVDEGGQDDRRQGGLEQRQNGPKRGGMGQRGPRGAGGPEGE